MVLRSYLVREGKKVEIRKLDLDFTVCKVQDYTMTDLEDEYCFTGKTDEERSLVCRTDRVPENVLEREDGFKGFRIQGILDFSLIGILANVAGILAENEISVFAISTYNTDYILTKAENMEKALELLAGAGYQIVS